MRVSAEALARELGRQLSRAYLVSGDEPLLVQEALDAIRATARDQGFEEREVHVADRGFDWDALLASSSSLSLFATRRIIEVRLPTGKPGDKGAKVLSDLAARDDPDTLLLVVTPKQDRKAAGAAWSKQIESGGVLVQVWPVDEPRMPAWIKGRLRRAGLRASDEAVRLLAARVEGNLLAAQQEIDKLALLQAGGEVDADTVRRSVADSARYDIFDLVDAALAGDPGRSLRVLAGLREEGVEPVLIVWALTRELRSLSGLAWQLSRGEPPGTVLGRVWQKRKPIVSAALKRHSAPAMHGMLMHAARADRVLKGQSRGVIWDELALLVAKLAGVELKLKATG